jgi:hypothetical protein
MDWNCLEKITHFDPGMRGLCGYQQQDAWLDAGQLEAAARDLAFRAARAAIVTGFCRATKDGITAETDGPPGALFLARALGALDIEVILIGDRYVMPLLEVGCRHWQLNRVRLAEMPIEDRSPIDATDRESSLPQTDAWCREFLAGPARGLTHLVSIERPGPSHTLESLRAQPRQVPTPEALFAAEVPERDRNRCHNMLGEDIDRQTAKAERLFELVQQEHSEVTTIGIGDGGNEIGMGSYAWEVLRAALGSAIGGRVVSRIAARHTLLAGVSDWAAYAVALAVCHLRRAQRSAVDWNAPAQRELIELLVREAGAVDGVTGRPTATVDGLDLDTYLQPLAELRKQCGM